METTDRVLSLASSYTLGIFSSFLVSNSSFYLKKKITNGFCQIFFEIPGGLDQLEARAQ